MALGPKAMGEAIAHNMKAKTGRSVDEWLTALDASPARDRAGALAWLKEQGLGHFQAQLVVDRRDGRADYADPAAIVDDLFRSFPDQRALYERVVAGAASEYGLTPRPCLGYIPLYGAGNRIVASLKPTRAGLYIGLVGDSFPVPVVPHKKSLGGSERMRHGAYVTDVDAAVAAIAAAIEFDAAPVA